MEDSRRPNIAELRNSMLNRPSKAVMTRVTLGIAALLLALSLPFVLHDVGYAQTAPIEYAENDTAPVASFSATDPEGAAIKWSLSGDDATDFSISENGVLTFKNSPNFESPADANTDNRYMVTVEAQGSGSGGTDSEELTIEVTNVEEAGTVTLNTLQPQVRVDVMATVSDPDCPAGGTNCPTGTTWQWYNSDDGSTWEMIDKATSATYTPAPADAGKYLRAVATYNDDKANPDDDPATMDMDESKDTAMAVSSAVLPPTTTNTAPDFKDDEGKSRPAFTDVNGDAKSWVAIDLKESATGGDDVGNPVIAVDDDTLTYTLGDTTPSSTDNVATGVANHAALFTIDRASAQISVKAGSKFDFTADDASTGNNVGPFHVLVTATDPTGSTDSVRVIITLTDVNEKPTINAEVTTENSEAGLTAISLDEGGADGALVASGNTGATYTALDSDNPFNDADTPARENDSLTWTKRGPDAGKFSLSEATGDADAGRVTVLSFTDAPDFEAKADADGNNKYEVTLVVTDSAGNEATRDVTVTVNNIEEAGTVKVSALHPEVGTQMTAELADPDESESGVTWQWWRTTDATPTLSAVPTVPTSGTYLETANRLIENADGTPGGNPGAAWVAISGATSSSYRPGTDDAGRLLLALATYTDGKANTEDNPATVPETGNRMNEAEVDRAFLIVGATTDLVVRTRQTDNQAPKFGDTDPVAEGDQNDPRERRVKENTGAGMNVGTPVTATDDDTTTTGTPRTDTITYSIGGPDGDLFEINQSNGQISVGKGTKLDYEATKNTYEVTVTATDPSGASTDTTVNIVVTDENEAPKITRDGPAEYAENDTAPVASFSATDPEGTAIKWSLSGDDATDFSISENGVLTFKNSPNFESPADANTDNRYMVTVEAQGSGSGGTDSEELTIEVTNVEEAGTVTLNTLQPQVRVDVMATVSDPDCPAGGTNCPTGTTWQWYNSDDGSTWEMIDKATSATYTPAPADAGKYLRAVATYNDDKANPDDDPATMDMDESKDTAMAVSSAVLPPTTTNTAPDFKDDEGKSRPAFTDVNGDAKSWVAIDLKESATGGDDVGNPVIAVDDDTLTYTLGDTTPSSTDNVATGVANHAALFTIDRASAQISVKAGSKFDFTADDASTGNNVGPFHVLVTATDPTGSTDSVRVIITLTDVNEKPTINAEVTTENSEAGLTAISLDEGGADGALVASGNTGATYTALDSDNPFNDADTPARENDSLTWTKRGPDAGKFSLSEATGDADAGRVTVLSFTDAPDFEAKADADGNNKYEVTLVVTDSAGNEATRDVTVTVNNIEEAGTVKVSALHPEVGTQMTAELADPDESESGVTWQWWRTTDATPTLSAVPTVPTSGTYLETANRLIENADGTPGGNPGAAWVAISGATSSSYRPGTDDAGRLLLALATYTDGKANTEDNPATVPETGNRMNEAEVDRAFLIVGATTDLVVRTRQTDNQAPKFGDTDPVAEGDQNDPRERRVKENTGAGMNVGTPVTATDDDTTTTGTPRTDTITYSIGGPDGDLFEINQSNGQISVGKGTKLDYEATKNTYEVTVTATDPSGASTDTTVNIIVTDENEAPKITLTPGGGTPPSPGMVGGLGAVSVPENTTAVATYVAPAEITSPTWSLSGPDRNSFTIGVTSGVLSFRSAPDYEAPGSADGDNVYMVTVVASGGGQTAELAVTVTVTDVTEGTPSEFDPLRYDDNDNGQIDLPEVIQAIRDYFNDAVVLALEDVKDVIRAYFRASSGN